MNRDSCDDEGARKLKAKIEEYWATRGFGDPGVKLEDAPFVPAMRSARTDVRSSMVNGMPRAAAVAAPKAGSRVKPSLVPQPPRCQPFSIKTRKRYEA